jgi:transcriptional regulator with XRE-family HTH domain
LRHTLGFSCRLSYMEVDVARLKALREENVLSQRELARMAGLTQMTVWRLENGYCDARPGTIRKIARILGVKPGELLKTK